MKKLLFGAVLCTTALMAASCQKTEDKGSGLNYAIMDTTVNPGDDFAKYAAGNWTQVSPKPADQPNWTAFTYIEQKNSQFIGEWYEAFGIKESDKLYVTPEERVRIW